METRAEQYSKKNSSFKKILLGGGEFANAMKLSYVSGLAMGATGIFTGEEWIPAIPPAMDFYYGVAPNAERAICYAMYGAGIATAYSDKIYSAVVDIVDKL